MNPERGWHVKNKIFFIAFFLLIPSIGLPTDVRIPFDREGRVWELMSSDAQRAGLLTNYPGLVSAGLYQTPDGRVLLEVHYALAGTNYRDSVAIPEAELSEIRDRWAGANGPGKKPAPEKGKLQFLAVTTISSAVYAADLTTLAGLSDSTVGYGIDLMIVSGGFFGPLFLLPDTAVTEAEAYMFGAGTLTGIGYAFAFDTIFGPTNSPGRIRNVLDPFLGIGLGWLGFQAANALNIGPGDALILNMANLAGAAVFASAVSALTPVWDASLSPRITAAAGIGGSLTTLPLAWLFTRTGRYTTGDALVMQISQALGVWLGMSVSQYYTLADAPRFAPLSLSLGAVLGIGGGGLAASGHDYSVGQAGMCALGTFAGGLLGLGLSYVTAGGNEWDGRAGSWWMLAGATGGLAAMLAIYGGETAEKPESAAFEWSVNPAALFGLMLEKRVSGYATPVSSLATATLRF